MESELLFSMLVSGQMTLQNVFFYAATLGGKERRKFVVLAKQILVFQGGKG